MAAAVAMYELNPINDVKLVNLPTVMYKMNNLHATDKKRCDMDPSTDELGRRQLHLLTSLDKLMDEVKSIYDALGHKFGDKHLNKILVNARPTRTTIVKPSTLPDGIIDFVISLSPMQPSLSPIFIAELLQKSGMPVATPTHLHSTVTDPVPDHFLNVTGGLASRLEVNAKRIVMTFVWKNDPFCPSLMFSPALQTRINGDSNIARYLCRMLLPDLYNEDNIASCIFIDGWLQYSTQLLHGSSKEKESIFKLLNAHLGKNDYFCSHGVTLADIAMLSAIIVNKLSFTTLPRNIGKWFTRLSKQFPNCMAKLQVPAVWMN